MIQIKFSYYRFWWYTYIFLLFTIGKCNVILAQNPIEAKRLFEEAERLYKSNNWPQAAEHYERARSLNPDKYKAITPYKRGLCFAKLKNCDSLKANFSRALLADPLRGGASSLTKLDEKLIKCGTSVANLKVNPIIIDAKTRGTGEEQVNNLGGIPVKLDTKIIEMPFERELGESAMALLGVAWISCLWLLIAGLRFVLFSWLEKSLIYLVVVWLASQLGYSLYHYGSSGSGLSTVLLIVYCVSVPILFLRADRATFETDRIFWSAWLGVLLVSMLYQARFELYQLYVAIGTLAISILVRWVWIIRQYNSRNSTLSTSPDVFSWNRIGPTKNRATGYDSVNRRHVRGDSYHSSDTFVYVDNSRTGYSNTRDDS
jgi:hypothetical protein